MRKYPEKAILEKYFYYDDKMGCLCNKITRNSRAVKNTISGNPMHNDGYIIVVFNNELLVAHRIIAILENMISPDSVKEIDHINHNKRDNRIENLRVVSHATNCKNQKRRTNNTSSICGVWYKKDRAKWIAEIKVDNKKITLGSFLNKEDAIHSRKEAEKKYGFHPNHGRRLNDV